MSWEKAHNFRGEEHFQIWTFFFVDWPQKIVNFDFTQTLSKGKLGSSWLISKSPNIFLYKSLFCASNSWPVFCFVLSPRSSLIMQHWRRAVVKSTFVESKTSPSPKRFESSPSPKRFESSPSPKRFESKSKWDGQNRERKKSSSNPHI